ncbi:M48 family metallopeptidase [uncultured Shimia sp.]|uniref:M48 family metallopeptidase n=1 Tax=uncultured Shimia sp. TaxID=573152 RepID=UPI0025D6E05D|nr:M48 family metallopeptidase [uncultured Shimia sp.]
MIENFRKDLNRRMGEGVYLSALKEVASRTPARSKPSFWLLLFSLLVLASPFVFVVLGVLLIQFDFPNLILLVLGGTCLAMAWFLRPRRTKLPERCLDRIHFPALTELVDQISERMNAPKVDKFTVFAGFNAYAQEAERQRILGIGSLLWLAADRDQRLALLAHEVAHLANKDAEKGVWGHQAEAVLVGLLEVSEPTMVYDAQFGIVERESQGLIADAISATFRVILETLLIALEKLKYADSQKAEYHADTRSAEVAGRPAVLGLLDIIVLIEPTQRLRSAIWPKRDENGLVFSQRMADTVFALPDEERQVALSTHEAELLAVDSTHPPTRYRKAFIEGVPDELLDALLNFDRWDDVDRELAPHFDSTGKVMAEAIREG